MVWLGFILGSAIHLYTLARVLLSGPQFPSGAGRAQCLSYCTHECPKASHPLPPHSILLSSILYTVGPYKISFEERFLWPIKVWNLPD